jgi:hypothetical protein
MKDVDNEKIICKTCSIIYFSGIKSPVSLLSPVSLVIIVQLLSEPRFTGFKDDEDKTSH